MNAEGFVRELWQIEVEKACDTDYEYYRVGDCQCPEPFLCQGRCQNGKQDNGSGDSGTDALQ